MIDDDESITRSAAEDVNEFIVKMSYQYDPLLTASLLVINGFKIYRTMFDDAEYSAICKKIYEDRLRIQSD
jgi:hypothetical protein